MGAKAVFLDRDGTVNTEEDFLSDPQCVRLECGAAEGLRILEKAGFLLVVVSNQSGVARGFFDESSVNEVNSRLRLLLENEGVDIAAFYYCPHHPEGTVPTYALECDCRKPAPGMFITAAGELGIDLQASYTVGDRDRDLEAGRRAGTKAVLVKTGYGLNSIETVMEMKLADYIAEDLLDAAGWIVSDSLAGGGPE